MSHANPPALKTPAADAAIATLANETATAPDEVRVLYEQEVAALREQAKVTQFVSVIATRLVRQRLRARSHSH